MYPISPVAPKVLGRLQDVDLEARVRANGHRSRGWDILTTSGSEMLLQGLVGVGRQTERVDPTRSAKFEAADLAQSNSDGAP